MVRWLFLAMAVILFLFALGMLALGEHVNGGSTIVTSLLFASASVAIAKNRELPHQPV